MRLFAGWGASRRLAVAERELRVQQVAAETAFFNALTRAASESTNIFNLDDNGTRFDRYAFSTGDALSDGDHLEMIRNMYQAHRTSPMCYGWIETFVKFTVGRDVRLKSKDVTPDGACQKVLDDLVEGYRWPDGRREKPFPHRINEHARRVFRGGEGMLREFVNRQGGKVYWRFLNEMWIASDGTENSDLGVVTYPNDCERVQYYIYWPNGNRNWFGMREAGRPVRIDGVEVIHTKIGDSDSRRGWPILLPVMSHLAKLEKLLDARGKMHWLKTLYALQRKPIPGMNPTLMKALHERQQASVTNTGGGKELAPRPGSVIESNFEFDFKTPSVDASDADTDIRRRALVIAVGLGFPEYIALGDSSNNNYQSGELAESPFVVWMRSWQEFFEPDIEWMGQRAIEAQIEAGNISRAGMKKTVKITPDGDRIESTVSGERDTRVEVGFPKLIERDVEKHTRALALQKALGYVDDETAITQLGYDPQVIKERLARDMENHKDEFEDDEGDTQGIRSQLQGLAGLGRRNGGGAGAGHRLVDAVTAGSGNGNSNGDRGR